MLLTHLRALQALTSLMIHVRYLIMEARGPGSMLPPACITALPVTMHEPTVLCLRSLQSSGNQPGARIPHTMLISGQGERPISGAEGWGGTTSLTVGMIGQICFRSPAHAWCLWAESNHHPSLTRREHDLHATEADF